MSSITINSTPISGYYVAGKTVAKLTYSKTTPRGASSVTVYFSANKGVTFASSSATSGTTVLTNTLPASTINYTFTVSVYAIDSRGNQSTTKTLTSSTVYAYAQPKITGKFIRVADATSTTEDSAGGYVYGTYSGTVGASVNGQNTITTTKCLMNGTGSSLASGFHTALAQSSGATFVVTVTDKVGTSVSQTFTVSTAVFPLDLYDNGSGTVGVGMGTTAEGGFVQSNMDIRIVKDNQTMVRGYADTGNIYARGEIGTSSSIYSAGEIKGDADVLAKGGFYSLPTGQVKTPTSANGMLLIKRASASADGTPNNGVVLEFGNSTTWKGQLFITDNGSEGVWTGGWYNGTHQAWRRLFESNDYRTQNTFTTSGVTYYNSRATLSAGGYFTSGKMVFVAFSLKINATMGAPDYWLMIQGLPKPRFLTALSCAGINKKGTYGAWINGNGEINIQTSSTSLASGDYIAITGFYFIS